MKILPHIEGVFLLYKSSDLRPSHFNQYNFNKCCSVFQFLLQVLVICDIIYIMVYYTLLMVCYIAFGDITPEKNKRRLDMLTKNVIAITKVKIRR